MAMRIRGGTVLNEFLNVSHNESGELRSDVVSSSQILNGTITDSDLSDTTNLTIGEKITFTLGGMLDNIVNGWLRITGNLNVTGNIETPNNISANYFIGNGSQLTSLPEGELGTSINSSEIEDGTILAEDISANAINTSHILDGNITDEKISSINWTKLNTVPEGFTDNSDNDTLYYAGGVYIYKNNSGYFILNETKLNETIDARDDDTTYTAGDGITVIGTEINATLGTAIGSSEITDDSIVDADISDATNLTLGEKITFALGAVVDNIVNGYLRVTGNLNVTGNTTSAYYFGDGSQLSGISTETYWNRTGTDVYLANTGDNVGIGTTNPSHELNVVGSVNITENLTVNNLIMIGNFTICENSTGATYMGYFGLGNCTL